MSYVLNVADIGKNFRKMFSHSIILASNVGYDTFYPELWRWMWTLLGIKLVTGHEKLNVRCVSSMAQRHHMKQSLKRLWKPCLPLGPARSHSMSMSRGSKRFLLSEFQLCYFWEQVMKQCEMYLVHFRDYLLVTNPTSHPSTPHAPPIAVTIPTSKLSLLSTGNLIYTQVLHFKGNIIKCRKSCSPDFWLVKGQ